MKTLFNRITVLLTLAVLTSQCKKDNGKDEPPAVIKDEWTPLNKEEHELGDDAWGFASGDKIYVQTFNGVLEVYDAKQNKWTGEKISFPAGFEYRYNCLITQSKDKIYIIGGEGNSMLKDFWEFTPSSSQWKKLPDCPLPLSGGNAYLYENTLYAGISRTSPAIPSSQGKLYTFSFATNTWNTEPINLNTNFGTNGICFQIGAEAYYGGGYSFSGPIGNPTTCYKYNLKSGALTRIEDLPTTFVENARPLSFIVNNKVYLSRNSYMISYDPVTNLWSKLKETPKDDKDSRISYCFLAAGKLIGLTQNGVAFEYK
jgi:hypothetical protein